VEHFWDRLNPLREKLLTERGKRIRPGRDEKVLTSWNSLMISAFVDGYRILRQPRYLEVARTAATFILDNLVKDGKLLRTWGRGQAKLDGYLDDYSYFVQALLDLAAVDFDGRWYEQALVLNEVVLADFTDETDGGFFYTSSGHEQLIARTKNFFDASTPSPTSVATMNLIRLARLMGRESFADRAKGVLTLYSPYYERVPDQFSYLLCDLDNYLAPASEIALLADTAKVDDWRQTLFTIYGAYLPNSVILVKDINAKGADNLERSPLFAQRQLVDGKPTTYICENFTCERPITDLDELEKRIRALSGTIV
jgi:uncharacterized protein